MKHPRFIILSAARCGSLLLTHALNAHPDLEASREPLNSHVAGIEHKDIILNLFGIELPQKGLLSKEHRDIITKPEYFDAIFELKNGFSVLYYQIGEYPNILRYIKKNDIKVLHLIRRDSFARYVSFCVAARCGVWHKEFGHEVDLSKIYIDPLKYQKDVSNTEYAIDRFDKEFNCYTIYYEDIVADWNNQLALIQGVLGVNIVELPLVLKKSIDKPLKDIVLNTEDFPEYFTGNNNEINC